MLWIFTIEKLNKNAILRDFAELLLDYASLFGVGSELWQQGTLNSWVKCIPTKLAASMIAIIPMWMRIAVPIYRRGGNAQKIVGPHHKDICSASIVAMLFDLCFLLRPSFAFWRFPVGFEAISGCIFKVAFASVVWLLFFTASTRCFSVVLII